MNLLQALHRQFRVAALTRSTLLSLVAVLVLACLATGLVARFWWVYRTHFDPALGGAIRPMHAP